MRYFVAVASVGTALAASLLLDIRFVAAPASLCFCATMLSVWNGGLGPGVLALALSNLAIIFFFVSPTYSMAIDSAEIPRVIINALASGFVAWMSLAQRRAVRMIAEKNADLLAENAERRRVEADLDAVAARLINAQEVERSRIGRELHDHISQLLGVLTIKIDQLRRDQRLTADQLEALDELRLHTWNVTDDVHSLSHRLHSSTLDHLGLGPALRNLVSEFSKRHAIVVSLELGALPVPLASDIALCLFRVTEEALTNIAKHSFARAASIELSSAPDGLSLVIEDLGSGFDRTRVQAPAGLGLVSMHERLRALHGTLDIDSARWRGTCIRAWVPIAQSDAVTLTA